ncbi:MAG: ABC transporter permease [Chloroflexi bacterium]|nr:MAG: ABC transporter permease [Chloroflexota bacterium]
MMITDLLENLRVALDGLVVNKMRSGLTMLGVVIGVAAVIALMSIGEGAQASITGEISAIGSNLLIVRPGVVVMGPGQSMGNGGGNVTTLTYADAEAIADPGNVPDAAVVAPLFEQSTQVVFGNENINASVVGTTTEYQDTVEMEVARGRFIEEKDVNGRSNVAVLGYQVAQDLFGGFDPLGKKIKVSLSSANGGRVSLTVVGVLEEKGDSMISSVDDMIFVPITTAQTKIFDGRNPLGEFIVTSVSIVAASEDRTDAAVGQIETLLLARHNIGPDEDADFSVISQADLLSMATQIANIMTIFLGSIAGISLLVGGIGIMNIMLVSVTERTREIGLRKAVGARKADILTQFLLEAVVLSILGGVIGILLGVGLAQLVDMTGVMSSVITLSSILMAVGFSFAIGLFFGIYPANQAASLNPIEALRYE